MALEDRSGRIDHGGARLVWQQVADEIAADIAAGRLAPGAKLPNEAELTRQYGVSRVTTRRAIKELADRGLLEVVHGRGTFVVSQSVG
ncbi:MAG: GntR family transcriptional regulator [Streptomycetales bacterium]